VIEVDPREPILIKVAEIYVEGSKNLEEELSGKSYQCRKKREKKYKEDFFRDSEVSEETILFCLAKKAQAMAEKMLKSRGESLVGPEKLTLSHAR
jgi:hypothetical protein